MYLDRKNNLSYPTLNSPFRTFRPENQILFTLLVAILTTIISYQIAALLFDLFLGFKPYDQANVSDIGILILSEDASLRSILSHLQLGTLLFPSTLATRKKKQPHSQHDNKHSYPSARVPVIIKFVLLLFAAPLANLTAILITMEMDRKVTFQQASFGGLAMGLRNLSEEPINPNKECRLVKTVLGQSETPLTSIFMCVSLEGHTPPKPKNFTTIRITRGEGRDYPRESLVGEVEIITEGGHSTLLSVVSHVDIRSEHTMYRLRDIITQEQRKSIFNRAWNLLMDSCVELSRTELEDREETIPDRTTGDSTQAITAQIACPYFDHSLFEKIIPILSAVQLVDAETFDLYDLEETNDNGLPVLSGHDLPFFTRRDSLVNFSSILIMTASIIILRFLVRAITKNDIHVGIELFLKDALQVPLFDSMLQDTTTIDYWDVHDLDRSASEYEPSCYEDSWSSSN